MPYNFPHFSLPMQLSSFWSSPAVAKLGHAGAAVFPLHQDVLGDAREAGEACWAEGKNAT